MRTLAAIATLLAVTTAGAETLEEKQYWKTPTSYVERTIKEAEKRCETTFTFQWIDKPTLREKAKASGYTPNGICENMINLVTMTCRAGEDEKQAVKQKITGFACGYKNPRTLEIKGGVLTYLGNNEQANFHDWAKPLLLKKL